MKLKAIILATGLINCIAFSAQAVDTTITVTGNVLQRTCTTPKDINVPLGNLYTTDFPATGSTSQWKTFSLSLTNCQNTGRVQASFAGTQDGSGYFANNGSAGNIAYSALFDHGLASKSDQRFASIRSSGNLTFSTAF